MTAVEAFKLGYAKLNEYKLLWLCLRGVFIFLALVITHYAGFITGFPIWVISAAAVDLFPTFSALFLFYLTFCYSVARVMGFVLSQFIVSMSIFFTGADRRGHKFRWLRKYVVNYKGRSDEESAYYWGMTVFAGVGLLFLTYVTPSGFTLSIIPMSAVLVLIFAAVLKTDILVAKPSKLFRKLKKRPRYRGNLISGMGFVFFGVVLSLSYYAGVLRFERLINEKPIDYASSSLKANLVVLISNRDSVLGIEETESAISWIYSSGEVVMKRTYEKKSEPKPSGDAEDEQEAETG